MTLLKRPIIDHPNPTAAYNKVHYRHILTGTYPEPRLNDTIRTHQFEGEKKIKRNSSQNMR